MFGSNFTLIFLLQFIISCLSYRFINHKVRNTIFPSKINHHESKPLYNNALIQLESQNIASNKPLFQKFVEIISSKINLFPIEFKSKSNDENQTLLNKIKDDSDQEQVKLGLHFRIARKIVTLYGIFAGLITFLLAVLVIPLFPLFALISDLSGD